jgi:hypothetical protein
VAASPPKAHRQPGWMVRIHDEVLGPFSYEQLSLRLYAQDVDWDAEVWFQGESDHEGANHPKFDKPVTLSEMICKRSTGKNHKPEAHLWIYDRKSIVGPFNPKEVKNAAFQGRFTSDAMICEKSTENGFVSLSDWLESYETFNSGDAQSA